MRSLKSKLKNLPQKPGVYQFSDKTGRVLYIGKAKNLRSRVRQYFAGNDGRPQIPHLMKETTDLDYTIVSNELESLYLERTLIQKHSPKYNIELKDDKNYAFIVIDYSTQIPQITIRRRISDGKLEIRNSKFEKNLKSKIINHKSVYFGPYTSAQKIRGLIFTARKTFGLCSAKKIGKPCFYFHLHRCPGVCAGIISADEYKDHLDKTKQLFSGKIAPTIREIQTEMQNAAKRKKFEKAARLRDQLISLKMLEQRQNVIMAKKVDWDVIASASSDGYSCVNLFKIREGKMLNKENFIYSNPNATNAIRTRQINSHRPPLIIREGEEVILQAFLEEYYLTASDIPKTVYIESETEDKSLIVNLLKKRAEKKVGLSIPQKGKVKKLINLSKVNAEEYLKNYLIDQAGHLDKINKALEELKKALALSKIPKRIEGYDISNIQGTNPVGSMVVFTNGLPDKSQYRKFKIQSKSTPDDFAMMREMLSRRLNRIKNQQLGIKNKDKWPLPDLIVIDGGRGQLNAALAALSTEHLALSTKIIGLAKRLEEIFVPGRKQPLILSKDNPALQLLQRLRDEAHRFGVTFHRKLRSKQAIKSQLDDVPGIGPKTKKLLKQKFGSVANIKKADFDELEKAVGKKKAKIVRQAL